MLHIPIQAKILSFASTIKRSVRRKKTVYKIINLSFLRERMPPAEF